MVQFVPCVSMPRYQRLRFLLIAGGFAALACGARCRAGDFVDTGREDHLRAGYLFNFAKFVDWPALKSTDAMMVCFAGASGVRDAFAATAEGKLIATHRVVLRTITAHDPTAGCQVLYVKTAADGAPGPALIGAGAMLTVGDQRGFNRQGGIIELFTENNRLRFDINLDAARRASLKISSSLLQLASHVDENAP